MKGLTLAQVRAAREDDSEIVAAVRRRLEAEHALEALSHLDGLSRDELAVLARRERDAVEPLPVIPKNRWKEAS